MTGPKTKGVTKTNYTKAIKFFFIIIALKNLSKVYEKNLNIWILLLNLDRPFSQLLGIGFFKFIKNCRLKFPWLSDKQTNF